MLINGVIYCKKIFFFFLQNKTLQVSPKDMDIKNKLQVISVLPSTGGNN